MKKKPKTEYPMECEEENDKLRKLLNTKEIPDLSKFTSEEIWKEEEHEVMERHDGK